MNQQYLAENVRSTYSTKKALQLLHTSADGIQNENNHTQRNITQSRNQIYTSTIQKYLSSKKNMITDNTEKKRNKLQGKEVPVQIKNKRTLSRPTLNLRHTH